MVIEYQKTILNAVLKDFLCTNIDNHPIRLEEDKREIFEENKFLAHNSNF